MMTTMAVTAAWDVGSFLDNATSTAKGWGGGLLTALGVIGLIVGAVFLIKKLMSSPQNQQQQKSWGTIAMLILVAGALSTGGMKLVTDVGSGGQKTISDLGGGSVVVQNFDHSGGVSGSGSR